MPLNVGTPPGAALVNPDMPPFAPLSPASWSLSASALNPGELRASSLVAPAALMSPSVGSVGLLQSKWQPVPPPPLPASLSLLLPMREPMARAPAAAAPPAPLGSPL